MNALVFVGFVLGGLLVFIFFQYHFTIRNQCPSCKQATNLERTSRPLLIKRLLFFLPTKAYVCYSCMKRFVRIG